MLLAVRGEVGPGQPLLLRRLLDGGQGADAGQRLVRPLRVGQPGVEEHGVRVGGVSDVHPGVGRPPRGEERHRGVVGVQRGREPDPVAHQPVERFEYPGGRDDLVAQGGPGHVPPEPPEDRLPAVQRQVVTVLRHDDVREKPGRCSTSRDRLRRKRRLNDLGIFSRSDHPATGGLYRGRVLADPSSTPPRIITSSVAVMLTSAVSAFGKTNVPFSSRRR